MPGNVQPNPGLDICTGFTTPADFKETWISAPEFCPKTGHDACGNFISKEPFDNVLAVVELYIRTAK